MERQTLTTQEVAEQKGVHRDTVSRWARQGKVKACREGSRWLVFLDDDTTSGLETPVEPEPFDNGAGNCSAERSSSPGDATGLPETTGDDHAGRQSRRVPLRNVWYYVLLLALAVISFIVKIHLFGLGNLWTWLCAIVQVGLMLTALLLEKHLDTPHAKTWVIVGSIASLVLFSFSPPPPTSSLTATQMPSNKPALMPMSSKIPALIPSNTLTAIPSETSTPTVTNITAQSCPKPQAA